MHFQYLLENFRLKQYISYWILVSIKMHIIYFDSPEKYLLKCIFNGKQLTFDDDFHP